MLKARQAIEYIVRSCGCESGDLFEGLLELENSELVSPRIIGRLHFIRKRANQSVHANENNDLEKVLDSLKEICDWFVSNHNRIKPAFAARTSREQLQSKVDDNQEIADASYKLGIACYYGNNARQDYKKAAAYFKQAALSGHPDAQYKLGIMYRFGKGVGKDDAIARGWLRQAAAQGHAEAQQQLGTAQRDEHQPSSENTNSVLSKILIWLLKLLVAVVVIFVLIHFR